MLLFDFNKFVNKNTVKGKISVSQKLVKELEKLDGRPIHRYSKNSFAYRLFGETHYIKVGSEKISIGEEFGTVQDRRNVS